MEGGLNWHGLDDQAIKSARYKNYLPLATGASYRKYRNDPKLSDARKLCCNLPKIQTKSPNLGVFCQKDANGIANSEDPDRTAPLGAV